MGARARVGTDECVFDAFLSQRKRRDCDRLLKRQRARLRRTVRCVKRRIQRCLERCARARRGGSRAARGVGKLERLTGWTGFTRKQQTGSKVEAESQLKVEFDAEMAKLKSQIDSSKGKIIGDLVASVTRA